MFPPTSVSRGSFRKFHSQGSGCILHLNIATCKWFPFLYVLKKPAMFQLSTQNEFISRSPAGQGGFRKLPGRVAEVTGPVLHPVAVHQNGVQLLSRVPKGNPAARAKM